MVSGSCTTATPRLSALHKQTRPIERLLKRQAEAGEWLLLLGFAHHLVSKGHIGLPCTLPALPRNSSINGPASSITVLGMISKQANLFLAPVRRKRAGKAPRLKEDAPAAQHQQQGPVATDRHGQHHQPTTTLYASGPADQGEQGQATSVPKWFSAHKTLCATCWALRTGASAAGGSKCQRCGRTHARGFSHEVSKRGGDDAADPVPWQQFSQVRENPTSVSWKSASSLRLAMRCIPLVQ